MGHISIRDLQKISGEAITALSGMTAIKSGRQIVGVLIPLRKSNTEWLTAALARADELAKCRNPEEDDAELRAEGIDPTNWSVEAVRALRAGEGS